MIAELKTRWPKKKKTCWPIWDSLASRDQDEILKQKTSVFFQLLFSFFSSVIICNVFLLQDDLTVRCVFWDLSRNGRFQSHLFQSLEWVGRRRMKRKGSHWCCGLADRTDTLPNTYRWQRRLVIRWLLRQRQEAEWNHLYLQPPYKLWCPTGNIPTLPVLRLWVWGVVWHDTMISDGWLW